MTTDFPYPEPTVGALIRNPEGKIFLMRSHKWKHQYCIPGGHIELGEKIEEAVVREAKEETGLDVVDLEFLCIQECIFDESFWDTKRHFLFFDYACRTDSTKVTLNEEAQAYVWVSLEEAEDLAVESYTRHVIEVYREKTSQPPE